MTFQEASKFITEVNFAPSDTWAYLGAGSGGPNLGLTEAKELNRKTSIYGNGEIYLAISEKRN